MGKRDCILSRPQVPYLSLLPSTAFGLQNWNCFCHSSKNKCLLHSEIFLSIICKVCRHPDYLKNRIPPHTACLTHPPCRIDARNVLYVRLRIKRTEWCGSRLVSYRWIHWYGLMMYSSWSSHLQVEHASTALLSHVAEKKGKEQSLLGDTDVCSLVITLKKIPTPAPAKPKRM